MQTIYLDISNKGVTPILYAKQNDVGRKFLAVINESGMPRNVSESEYFSAWYFGESGEGNYTHVGERSAFSVNGNKVEVELITQMLSNSGNGLFSLVLHDSSGKQIGLWNIPYCVEELPGAESESANEYYTAFSQTVQDAISAAERAENATSKFVRKNLLDNWYLANPVNQRGKSEYVGAGYTIDRWKIEGTANASLKVVDGGIQFINQGGAGEICRQYAEGGLAGKQVTFSILVTELTGNAYFAIHSQPLHVGLNTQTFSVGESGVPTTYFWISHHGGSITVAAAKLELGDTQTLAHEENGVWVLNEIPNYAEELAKCKRYLQVYRPQTLSGQTVHSPIGIGVADSENRLEIDIPLSAPLRNGVLPSLLYSGDICAWDGQTERTATDFWVIGVSDADLRVGCSTSGATARGIYTLAVLKSNMDGYFMINAEL